MRKLICEFIGTAVLVAFGCGSAVTANALLGGTIFGSPGVGIPLGMSTLLIAFAFGLSVVAMAYTIGQVSGAHINPAVSFSMLLAGRMSLKDFIGYIIAQFLGGICGAWLLMTIMGTSRSLGANGYGVLSGLGIGMWTAVLVEVLLTFVFTLVYLGATSKKENAPVAGLIVGLSLTLVHIMGIPFTGTSVNPARSLGPALFTGGLPLAQIWVFLLAPLVGAAIASLVYRWVMVPEDEVVVVEGKKSVDDKAAVILVQE